MFADFPGKFPRPLIFHQQLQDNRPHILPLSQREHQITAALAGKDDFLKEAVQKIPARKIPQKYPVKGMPVDQNVDHHQRQCDLSPRS